MKNQKTPFILRPLVMSLCLVAALVVCALAFRAGEQLKTVETEAKAEIASLQESRAYYQGHIAAKPIVRSGHIDLPALPEIPENISAENINPTEGQQAIEAENEIASLSYPLEEDYHEETAATKEVVSPSSVSGVPSVATGNFASGDRPKIVIIIDDMGMDKRHTREALTLPAPVTFAWLPYAQNIQELVNQAKQSGHENIVHMPMEPESRSIDAGPTVLKADMSEDALRAMLAQNFESFEGYTGFNNHMGSLLTQNPASMQIVMTEAKARGLMFIDSRTSPDSVAADVAAAFGVPYAVRDVFLDHYEDMASVLAALQRTEDVARRQGVAVAIGHPKENTLAALAQWIPELERKGMTLVPVSDVVRVFESAAGESSATETIPTQAFDSSRQLLQQPVSAPAPY
ncbi:MAG: divergent polysaccharide deacetylase family protein [Micavibrio sp.]